MKRKENLKIFLCILGMGTLTACGGGGGDSSSSTSSSTGVACLLGSWSPDLRDLAGLQKEQLNASSVTVTGNVVMKFVDGENGETDVNSLTTNATFSDQPPISVNIFGLSNWTYLATEDGDLQMETVNFQFTASTEVLGETLEVPVSSDDGLFGSVTGGYVCSGNRLEILSINRYAIARFWNRIN